MSVHKNFIEGYGKNRNKLCDEKIFPYQDQIFKLFSDKFHYDAEKDGTRGRNLLKSRGNKCGELCNEIHLILGGNDFINENLKNIVNDIVNLDYNSLSEVFQLLEEEYSKMGDQQIANRINLIYSYLKKMWEISASHTTIKKQSD